jgi:hypothetical protein
VVRIAEESIADIYAPLSINDPLKLSAEYRMSIKQLTVMPVGRQATSCTSDAIQAVTLFASELDLDRSLASLQPSPVPIIWLERWRVVKRF